MRGVSGFGYALLATPLLTFIFDAKSAVVINIILGTASNVMVLFYTWKYVDFKRAAFINLGGILGVPIGAYLLSLLEPLIIKLAIGVIAIPFAIVLMLGYSHRFRRERLSSGIAGFLGGVFGSSTSFAGPPVVLYLLNQGFVKERLVATIAASFLGTCITSIGAIALFGVITADHLVTAAFLLPVLCLGSYLGVKLLPRLSVSLLRRITLTIIIISASGIIVNVATTLL
jgi:uncharacterized membrane protein YfcA